MEAEGEGGHRELMGNGDRKKQFGARREDGGRGAETMSKTKTRKGSRWKRLSVCVCGRGEGRGHESGGKQT